MVQICCVKQALMVVFPKTNQDVVKALEFVKEHHLDLAVKCGGHASNGGSSSEGGMVIDLAGYMNQVETNKESQTAVVGGGCNWGQVDDAADFCDLAAVGGTVGGTGVAGLLLGGGYSYQTGLHGLACDQLISATIIDGNLDILEVSATSHPDLFWAIRGGGGNFGIVTSLTIQLHEQKDDVWTGIAVIPEENWEACLDQVVVALKDWWALGHADGRSGIHVIIPYEKGEKISLKLDMYYGGSQEDAKSYYRLLMIVLAEFDIPIEEQIIRYKFVNDPDAIYDMHRYLRASAIEDMPSSTVIKQMASRIHESSTHDFYGYILFQSCPNQVIRKNGNPGTAFAGRDLGGICVTPHVFWDGSLGAGGERLDRARQLAVDITGYAGEEGDGTFYGNFATENRVESVAKRCFGDNYPKLQRIKAKHDPERFFMKWLPIEPLADE